jgi:hypothetical protein
MSVRDGAFLFAVLLSRSASLPPADGVIVLDALWRWTAEQRRETVQSSPAGIQSETITLQYPPKN